MANPLPLPGPITGNLVCHTTFVTLYADETADPWQGDYQPIMDRVDLEMNRMLTPLLLLEQAVGAGPVPQAFVLFLTTQPSTHLLPPHPVKICGSAGWSIEPMGWQFLCLFGRDNPRRSHDRKFSEYKF